MQIKVCNHIFECSNQEQLFLEVYGKIQELEKEEDLVVSHAEIDGITVYDDYQKYIFENIESIENAEIVMVPYKYLLDDTLLETKKYIDRALPEIKKLSDEFYLGVTEETWIKFEQLIEGLQWISNMLNLIEENEKYYSNQQQYSSILNQLQQNVKILQEGIENEDKTLIGDVLLYEIVPVFEELSSEINSTTVLEKNKNNLH